ncbi:MAG: sigma-70 family RNA polymerase sigma factor [Cyclobacteriaceae bacterium]|nr:sigma-70 family RNA polymerase sigma factor [Cyclobacteriaceae bacterium]
MDTELLDLFKQGNRQAFEVIYYRHAKGLYRFARKNIRSKEDCEEMVHDVFESLINRRETLNIESLKHYLFTSIRYMIIRYFSHRDVKRKFAEHYRLFEQEYEEPEKAQAKTPEFIHASLLEHIHDLPERCREAIRLRITENLSNGEIASRMNITRRTAELYISKAFAHLRASYGKIYKTG